MQETGVDDRAGLFRRRHAPCRLLGNEPDSVEIDPAVVDVAERFFGFEENENVNVIVKDARVFVKQAGIMGREYDYIILDAFNGDYIPEHLMTKEWLEENKKILADDGVLVAIILEHPIVIGVIALLGRWHAPPLYAAQGATSSPASGSC